MGPDHVSPRCLIVARHGKTFAPGEPAVWLGCQQNPPLSEQGQTQANILGQALEAQGIEPLFAACSPLRRARQTIDIALGHRPTVHPTEELSLMELDYGRWTGKTPEQIVARGDGEALDQWQTQGVWPPKDVGFSPSYDQVRTQLMRLGASWHARLSAAPTDNFLPPPAAHVGLVVSHSGRLRLLPELMDPATRDVAGSGKLACGHVAILIPTHVGWACRAYNVCPSSIDFLAAAALA